MCVWDPVDRRSGDGTMGSVQQSCYRNISPSSSLPCSSWCAAGIQLSAPGRAVRAVLSTQPQQRPISRTVGVLVQNAWSADAPRVVAMLGMVLLTCKKNIDIFWSANEIPFTFQKKPQKTKQLLLTSSYVATSISYNPLHLHEVQKPKTGWKVF